MIYEVHKQSGLGNMIRGYFTAMTIGILTNRCVQGIHFHSIEELTYGFNISILYYSSQSRPLCYSLFLPSVSSP